MIAVTGSRGFIGSALMWKLATDGWEVKGFDRKNDGVDLVKAGYNYSSFDTVIHLAANLTDSFQQNFLLTKQISHTSRRIIFASSAAVYGDNLNAKEDDKIYPYGVYGEIKREEEKLLLPTDCILRFGNVYGPGSDHGIVANLIHGQPTIYNSGESVRDFVHVDDIVDGIILALKNDWMGIYNLATGKGTKIKDVVAKYNHTVKPSKEHKEEIEVSVLNISKAREKGYSPKHEVI